MAGELAVRAGVAQTAGGFTAEQEQVIAAAAELMRNDTNSLCKLKWVGYSGVQVTGAEAAGHLEAVKQLLNARGWKRTLWGDSREAAEEASQVEEAEEEWVEELRTIDIATAPLRKLLTLLVTFARAVIEEFTGDCERDERLTLRQAMQYIGSSRVGDSDTERVAEQCLEIVLRACNDGVFSQYGPWGEKVGRTFGQVEGLLTVAAEFARRHGPRDVLTLAAT